VTAKGGTFVRSSKVAPFRSAFQLFFKSDETLSLIGIASPDVWFFSVGHFLILVRARSTRQLDSFSNLPTSASFDFGPILNAKCKRSY
jgi:hypothetical protein